MLEFAIPPIDVGAQLDIVIKSPSAAPWEEWLTVILALPVVVSNTLVKALDCLIGVISALSPDLYT